MTPERQQRLRTIAKAPPAEDHQTLRGIEPLPVPAEISAVTRVTRVTRDREARNDLMTALSTMSDRNHDSNLPAELREEIEERAAIAQHEAGFPAAFALAFAQLQATVPAGVDRDHWWQAVSAMGGLLDACRETATARFREP